MGEKVRKKWNDSKIDGGEGEGRVSEEILWK